jgi:hypothetical protein
VTPVTDSPPPAPEVFIGPEHHEQLAQAWSQTLGGVKKTPDSRDRRRYILEQIKPLFLQGMTINAIATHLGLSVVQVGKRLKADGVMVPKRKRPMGATLAVMDHSVQDDLMGPNQIATEIPQEEGAPEVEDEINSVPVGTEDIVPVALEEALREADEDDEEPAEDEPHPANPLLGGPSLGELMSAPVTEQETSAADIYQAYMVREGVKILQAGLRMLRPPKTVKELSELDQLIRRNLGLNPTKGSGSEPVRIDISILNNGAKARVNQAPIDVSSDD